MSRILIWLLGMIQGKPEKRPVCLKIRSARWFITLTVTIATATDIFLYAVIVPVLPFALPQRMHVEHSRVQLWISVMLAVYGGFLLAGSPIFGIVADRTATRRAPLLFGLCLLTGATILLCVARSIVVFISGRALQGLSGAIVWTTGLALLVDTVGKDGIGLALGYVGTGLSISMLLAPMLGGIVYQKGGYYAVFAMCFALLGVDILFRVLLVERKVAKQWIDFDNASDEKKTVLQDDIAEANKISDQEAILETPVSISGLNTAIKIESAQVLQPAVSDMPKQRVGTAVNMTERQQERKPRRNLPPIVHLLMNPRFLVALFGNFTVACLLTAFDSTLPMFVRQTFHWSSVGAGLVFLPIITAAFFGPFIGKASDHFGPKRFAVVGFLFAIPFLILLRLVQHDSIGHMILLCVLLLGYGAGTTTALMALMAEIAYSADVLEQKGVFGEGKSAYAQAYGLFNTVYAGGMLIGPIWGGGVKDTSGFGSVGWSLSILAAAAAVACFFLTGGAVSIRAVKRRLCRRRDEELQASPE